ncbi:cyclase family protein [Halomarina rubra]|uniref:Cyclase family protein n=1 Tax=Halomarina rubra TaxID=2071873 RepID=A0ABD6AW38_9EURY|nr:cyclase family protein [Halomarina rubra]
MWVDLSQPFGPGMDHSTALAPPRFERERSVADDGVTVTRFDVPSHAGTHVDAPAHVLDGGATLDAFSLETFAGEAVVVDAPCGTARELDVPALRAGLGDHAVRPGDVVLVHTGWAERRGTDAYHEYPWLAPEAATWLLDRGVKLFGTDTLSPDRPRALRSGQDPYPVHRRLLEAGVPVVENLRLGAVAGERVWVSGFPLQFDGDGAPARFVARRPDG